MLVAHGVHGYYRLQKLKEYYVRSCQMPNMWRQ